MARMFERIRAFGLAFVLTFAALAGVAWSIFLFFQWLLGPMAPVGQMAQRAPAGLDAPVEEVPAIPAVKRSARHAGTGDPGAIEDEEPSRPGFEMETTRASGSFESEVRRGEIVQETTSSSEPSRAPSGLPKAGGESVGAVPGLADTEPVANLPTSSTGGGSGTGGSAPAGSDGGNGTGAQSPVSLAVTAGGVSAAASPDGHRASLSFGVPLSSIEGVTSDGHKVRLGVQGSGF